MSEAFDIITLEKPTHVADLRSCGILVTPIMTSATLTVRDKAAGVDLALSKHANSKAVEVSKKLAAHMPEHKALQNHRQTMYNGLKVYTYDFAGDSRYLPSVRFESFAKWWKELASEHARLKAAFLAAWPNVRSQAAFELGDLFNTLDYPTTEELERKFTLTLVQSEVPEGDFRNVMFHELLEDATDTLQQHVNTQVQAMLETQIEQVATVIKSLSYCCETELVVGEDGKTRVKRRKLYDSTLQRALELCEVFDKCNVSGSTVLTEVKERLLDVLEGVSIDVLRESDSLRQDVKQSVDEIIEKFAF